MRLALSVFKNCISTVFDSADQLLIVETDEVTNLKKIPLKFVSAVPLERVAQLKDNDIDVLICGAISRQMQALITSQGIVVHPFIRGEVDSIVSAYKNNQLEQAIFSLPGCRRHGTGVGFRGQRGKRCRWR